MSDDDAELTLDEILSSDDRKIIPVAVPEWSQKPVYIRAMSGLQLIALSEIPSKNDSLVFIVAASVVRKSGDLMFSPGDVERLKTKSVAALTRIQDAAMKLNNLSLDNKAASAAKNG